MRSLSKNILHTIFTQIPSLIISIVSGIFLTRLLGPEGKGVFAVYVANVEILALLFSLGTEQGIVYFISNKKIKVEKILGIAIIVYLISVIANFFIIFFLNIRILFVSQYDEFFFRAYIFIIFVITFFNSLMIAFLKAKKRFDVINKVSILGASLNLLVFSVLFFLYKNNYIKNSIYLIFSLLVALSVVNIVIYVLAFRVEYKIKPSFDFKKTELFAFLKFTIPGYWGMLVNFLNYRLDIWIVQYFKGTYQLGLYVLAVNFSQLVMMLSKIVASVTIPYLSENDKKQRQEIFLVYSRINFLMIFVLVSVLFFVGEYLLVFLYGVDFIGSIGPFRILIVGMIFTGASQLFSSYLYSSGRNDLCLYANLTGLFFTVILDLTLIPKYGIIGSAYATFFSYLSIFIVYISILKIKERFYFTDLFIIKKSDIKIKKVNEK